MNKIDEGLLTSGDNLSLDQNDLSHYQKNSYPIHNNNDIDINIENNNKNDSINDYKQYRNSAHKVILLLVCFMLAFLLITSGYLAYAFAKDPLPRRIKIYVSDQGITSYMKEQGYIPKLLPVANIFIETPGCYISCNSTNPDKGVYKTSPNIYVIGLIRIEGQYEGAYCHPRDYETVILKDEVIFRSLCSKAYQCIGNSCWATPETGGLFGLK